MGILWIIVFYITHGLSLIPDLGMWNVSVGVAMSMLMTSLALEFMLEQRGGRPVGQPFSICGGCYRVLSPSSYILI